MVWPLGYSSVASYLYKKCWLYVLCGSSHCRHYEMKHFSNYFGVPPTPTPMPMPKSIFCRWWSMLILCFMRLHAGGFCCCHLTHTLSLSLTHVCTHSLSRFRSLTHTLFLRIQIRTSRKIQLIHFCLRIPHPLHSFFFIGHFLFLFPIVGITCCGSNANF